MNFFMYLRQNFLEIMELFLQHIELTAIAVMFSILIGVPLGVLTGYIKKIKKPVLGFANLIQAIPSIALLGLMIPLLGIGKVPAIVAVTLYSLLPIVKSTNTGIVNISPQTMEAAKGIGLTGPQRLIKVQIPIAFPYIMSGIRISAVTAVGLMTMAAYIGADGLGKLVISGISSMNMNKVLAGAIPACILALLVDFIFSIIEKLSVPKGIAIANKSKRALNPKLEKATKILSVVLIAVFVLSVIIVPPIIRPKYDITIGSKTATEPEILNHIYSEYIENKTDLKIDRKTSLGDTQPIYEALRANKIDIIFAYSGTVYSSVLGECATDERTFEDRVEFIRDEMQKQYKVESLELMEFNNTYTLAVKNSFAIENNLETISDLVALLNSNSDVKLGITYMFNDRDDGLPGIRREYGLNVPESQVETIDGALRYQAIENNEVQVIDAYSTDGLLVEYDLFVLEDDKSFFPKYNMIPMVKSSVLEKYPEIGRLINELKPYLTLEAITRLNYEIDVNKREARQVAIDFLRENGLID